MWHNHSMIMRHISGGLRINFDHLGLLNMHLNLSNRVSLYFAPIEVQPPWQGIKPASPRLAALHITC